MAAGSKGAAGRWSSPGTPAEGKAPEVEGGADGHGPEGEEGTHLVVVGADVAEADDTLKLQGEEPLSCINLTESMPHHNLRIKSD